MGALLCWNPDGHLGELVFHAFHVQAAAAAEVEAEPLIGIGKPHAAAGLEQAVQLGPGHAAAVVPDGDADVGTKFPG